jgi:hypothetical protein
MNNKKKPRNPDHVRRINMPAPNNEVIEERIISLVQPAVFGQGWYARLLGLRDRLLGYQVMIAAVLTLLWRQVPSVSELARMLKRENLLWAARTEVSQQALSKRFLAFPAKLFQRVLFAVLPVLKERWTTRQRPLPSSIVQAMKFFSAIYAADGSTLEALFRKLDSLKDLAPGTLAGKICTVINLATRLPEHIWFNKEPLAHDTNFLEEILKVAAAGTLWIFDRGFYDFAFFEALILQGAHFITRTKSNLKYTVSNVIFKNDKVRDSIILVNGCLQPLRLIEVHYGTTWYRYLTSVVDPCILSPEVIADLYRRRWRIEEAFFIVKRILHLSYLWTGSLNGVLLQVWSTWLFFAVLVDLGDEVAEELMLPFDRISLEMVFRGIYHFSQAYQRGEATDLVKFLADPENRDLGIIKRKRNKPLSSSTDHTNSRCLEDLTFFEFS